MTSFGIGRSPVLSRTAIGIVVLILRLMNQYYTSANFALPETCPVCLFFSQFMIAKNRLFPELRVDKLFKYVNMQLWKFFIYIYNYFNENKLK